MNCRSTQEPVWLPLRNGVDLCVTRPAAAVIIGRFLLIVYAPHGFTGDDVG
jgi:hypothetical protein